MKDWNRGWVVTISAMGINLMCGMIYSWSVFSASLVKDLGFSNTQASIPFTVALAMLALLAIPGGRLQDKFGPRICGTICGILCGAGMIISAYAESITVLAISFGVISGSGCGLAYGATTPASVKWFPPQKRGLISGLVVGGVGLAAIYVAPMTQYFINAYGVKKAFLYEGILFAVGILILAQLLANPPEGYELSQPAKEKGSQSKKVETDYTPIEMMKTPPFWIVWVVFLCGSIAGLMIIGHVTSIAKHQAQIQYAFIFVAILAVFNASGRVVGGAFSDKLGRKKALLIMFGLQAINMFLFKHYTTSITLTIGIGVAGICYGSLLAIFPALIFDYYGMKNGGVNYGIVFTSWGLGGFVGPMMAGYIMDLNGTYNNAYLLACGLLIASVIIVHLFLRSPNVADLPKHSAYAKAA